MSLRKHVTYVFSPLNLVLFYSKINRWKEAINKHLKFHEIFKKDSSFVRTIRFLHWAIFIIFAIILHPLPSILELENVHSEKIVLAC